MFYDRKISASMREHKRLACSMELKAVDQQGRFAGYASVFGVLDNQKDIIYRGAFTDTIKNRVGQIKLLWQHQPEEPIGTFNVMFEDARGLYVEGQLLLEVARAREALALLKAGIISGLSIGYSPLGYRVDPDTGVRQLKSVELWEISLVTFPANEQANVTVVKTAPPPTSAELAWLGIAASSGINALCEAAGEAITPEMRSIDEMYDNDNVLHDEMHHLRKEITWMKSCAQMLEIKAYADRELARKYSPDQSRDDHGRWTSEGGSDAAGTDSSTDSSGGAPPDDTNDSTDNATISMGGTIVGVTPGGVSYDDQIQKDMTKRDWTPEEIDAAQQTGPRIDAIDKETGEPAMRYVNPQTGKSVVINNNTNEVVQVGKANFIHSVESGDAPGAVMRPGPLVHSPEITPGGGGRMGDIFHPSGLDLNPRDIQE